MAGFSSTGRRLRGRPTNGAKKTAKVAKRALKLALHNRETRIVIDALTSVAFTASRVLNITYLQPNATGEKCTFQKIEGKIWVRKNTSSVVTDSWRCDLILDRQPNGVELSPLLAYTSASPRITALIDLGQTERFKIARSWMGAFDEADGNTSRMINFSYRTGLVTECTTSFVQANIVKNAYYFVFWTESATNTPIMTFSIQSFVTN